jgi:hypothetical protein
MTPFERKAAINSTLKRQLNLDGSYAVSKVDGESSAAAGVAPAVARQVECR